MVHFRSKVTWSALSVVIHLPFSCCSYLPKAAYSPFNHTASSDPNHLSPKMTFEVTLHGVLLWASFGFLMPIGILIIKTSNREQRLKFYFYFHLVVQMLSVLLATVGAIMSIKTFENAFNNKHQRIGLALYGAIWVQVVLGFCRPHRGSSKRIVWYILHWAFGTVICVVGILNIYTGLDAFDKRTGRNVRLWKFLFTAEIFALVVFYLVQDKWDYIRKQGVIIGEGGQVRPSEETSLADNNENLWRQPCSKVNALKNLFN